MKATSSSAAAASSDTIAAAASDGFLAGMNEILLLGGLLSLVGAVAALALVREHEIDRAPLEVVEGEPAPSPAPA